MSAFPELSVIVAAHNPDRDRLRRTLGGLRAQTLPAERWECLLVDNASAPAILAGPLAPGAPANLRVLRESALGLTAARLRGFTEAVGGVLVLVDDDNLLARGYLACVVERFAADPGLGALGGRSLAEFETPPPTWAREFDGLLALRDLGPALLRADWRPDRAREYPLCAPIGAGMALRREGATAYATALAKDPVRRLLDRAGSRLVSGGDNDLVMTVLEAGFGVAYDPALELTHLIPAQRCTREYLGRLNRAVARSWVRVLGLHGIRPWSAVGPVTVPLRRWRSWFRCRAWRGPAEWVRWQGRCGRFEGQANLMSASVSSP